MLFKSFSCALPLHRKSCTLWISFARWDGERRHTCIRRRRSANVRMRSRIRRTASCSSRHVLVGTSRHCCAAASRNLACAALTPSKDCALPIAYTHHKNNLTWEHVRHMLEQNLWLQLLRLQETKVLPEYNQSACKSATNSRWLPTLLRLHLRMTACRLPCTP